jgi:hypothetical protein
MVFVLLDLMLKMPKDHFHILNLDAGHSIAIVLYARVLH